MFRSLRIKKSDAPQPYSPFEAFSRDLLAGNQEPVNIRYLNHFEEGLKARIYRSLIPPHLLRLYEIDPLRWTKFGKPGCVRLDAAPDTDRIVLAVSNQPEPFDPYFVIELQDNIVGGIDLNWLQLSDPFATRYAIDRDEEGKDTQWGTVTRNLAAETAAKDAGLAPAQVRAGAGASQLVFTQLETFLAVLGQQALFLEPLTYASAWVFERRGFAYVRGHKLMDQIHEAFQLSGALRAALDGSTPFRQPDQWHSIRGRAWAIHDGVLDVIGAEWDQLRMIKQIGKHAGVNTAGNTPY